MFFGNNVQDTRQVFYVVWHKLGQGQPLDALERQLADVILAHPEYHPLLDKQNQYQDQAWFPELGQTNPFLHMGLHMAIREQISTDRPQGINNLFQQLLELKSDAHSIEHQMMDCLAECLWLAQRNQTMPDETEYMNALKNLCHK